MIFRTAAFSVAATVLASANIVVNAAVQDLIPVGNRRPEDMLILPDGESEKLGLGPGTFGLVSEYYFGGVIAVNIEDGSVSQLVPSLEFGQRGMLGIQYKDGTIFAASGGPRFLGESYPASVYALNAVTGETIVQCEPEGAQFMNDMVIVGETAYVTDTLNMNLLVWDLEAALKGTCSYYWIPLKDPFPETTPDGTPASNGIVWYNDGLLFDAIGHGSLYWLDLATNETTEILAPGTMDGPDGMALKDDILYVAENFGNKMSTWKMEGATATPIEILESDNFDSPTCVAFADGYVWTANARFGSLPDPADNESNPEVFTEIFTVSSVMEVESDEEPDETSGYSSAGVLSFTSGWSNLVSALIVLLFGSALL